MLEPQRFRDYINAMWIFTLWFVIWTADGELSPQRRIDVPMPSGGACKAEEFRVHQLRRPFEERERYEATHDLPHQTGLLGVDAGYPVLDAPWEILSERCEYVPQTPGV